MQILNNSTKLVLNLSVSTCAFITILVLLQVWEGTLYDVGSRSSWSLLVIFAAETLKVLLLNNYKLNNVKNRKTKPKTVIEWIKDMFFILGSIITIFIAIILFGAPALSDHKETMLLSILITTLTMYPLSQYAGIEATLQCVTASVKCPFGDPIMEMLMRNVKWTVCASWLGAIVIPLDWNRAWQVWPLPCFYGAIIGFYCSNLVNIMQCNYKTKIFQFV